VLPFVIAVAHTAAQRGAARPAGAV
jgi:hypothetical protein